MALLIAIRAEKAGDAVLSITMKKCIRWDRFPFPSLSPPFQKHIASIFGTFKSNLDM
jgi:hypothetical protein